MGRSGVLRPYRELLFGGLDLAAASGVFLLKRSTRPAVSTIFVAGEEGVQLEQISTRRSRPSWLSGVRKAVAAGQCTVTW